MALSNRADGAVKDNKISNWLKKLAQNQPIWAGFGLLFPLRFWAIAPPVKPDNRVLNNPGDRIFETISNRAMSSLKVLGDRSSPLTVLRNYPFSWLSHNFGVGRLRLLAIAFFVRRGYYVGASQAKRQTLHH